MSFGKARSRRVEPARGWSSPLGPLPSTPAAAESSLWQGRGRNLELQNPIGNFLSFHRSRTALCDPFISSTAGRKISNSLSIFISVRIPGNCSIHSHWIRCNMSEPTPVFDPPVVDNGTSAVETEGSAPPAATTDNGGLKENNSQDVTMAGLEDSGVKAAKTGTDPAVSATNRYACQHCSIHCAWMSLTTTCTSAFTTIATLLPLNYVTPMLSALFPCAQVPPQRQVHHCHPMNHCLPISSRTYHTSSPSKYPLCAKTEWLPVKPL